MHGDLGDTPVPRPAASLERARRRHRRVWLLLCGFLVLIPVGCAGPWALSLSAAPEYQKALFYAGLLLPFVGLGGALLMRFDLARSGRGLALAEQAERL